ncbi:MAG: protein TolR [Syntrophobacteraceae bacterium]|jgi:biopolymer transport protein TolR|nr:protein TolR [Syntrophobacteraceae bacterium]
MQSNSNSNGMVSDINVTPLVDVMLVLLIIFMVTAPMMTHGVDVKLPETSAPAIPTKSERLVVSITGDHKIFINEQQVEFGEFPSKLAAINQNRADQEGVFLRADDSIPYGYVMQVMGLIRQAGITKIGMVTEPEKSSGGSGGKKVKKRI